MRISRFSDEQIADILQQDRAGVRVVDLCRTHHISSATFYKWRAKFGAAGESGVKYIKELEGEVRRLKRLYADEKIKAEMAKAIIVKKL
jgi:putative transposase